MASFHRSVVYQIYLKSFYDSNGYDISDYCAIDPAMGTTENFEEFVVALSAHGIGVMLNMVLNHSSTEHEWFRKALVGDEHYQRYYYLRDPKSDGSLPTNWV